MAKEQKVVVKLRLSQSMVDILESEGAKHGRKLAAEAAYRLESGNTASKPAPRFPGWPSDEAQIFEQFGEAVARLLAGITVKTGTKMSRQERLGFLRVVLPVLLDELGASTTPDEEDAEYFRSWAKDALTDASAPRKRFAGYLKSEGIETEHVESGLAVVANLKKACEPMEGG